MDIESGRQGRVPLFPNKNVEVLKSLGKYEKRVLSVFFCVLEAGSVVLELLGKSKSGFLLAAFLLSVVGFVMTVYVNIASITILQLPERQFSVMEVVFSSLQLIGTFLQVLDVKNSYVDVSAVYPLAFAIIVAVFVFKKDSNLTDYSVSSSIDACPPPDSSVVIMEGNSSPVNHLRKRPNVKLSALSLRLGSEHPRKLCHGRKGFGGAVSIIFLLDLFDLFNGLIIKKFHAFFQTNVAYMLLDVDLDCNKCLKKVKKVLHKFPEIHDQVFDENNNKVMIKVVCRSSPEEIRDKLCFKGGGSIKSIEIVKPPESP